MLLDASQVDRGGPAESGRAVLGKNGECSSTVGRAHLALDQLGRHHAVHEAGEAAAAEQEPIGQPAHAQAVVGRPLQVEQHLVPGERKALLVLQLTVEAVHHRGVGPQEGAPRRQLLLLGPGSHEAMVEGNRSCVYNS